MNHIYRIAVALVVCGALASCAVTQSSPTKITSCYSSLSGSNSALWYAKEKGYFQKHGLDVELLLANGSTSVATLIAGQAQICQSAGINAISAAQAGEDIVVVAGVVNTSPYRLIVHPDIKRPEQLKGKTFAVRDLRGGSEFALRLFLSSVGLSIDQVKIVSLPTPQASFAAMESGAVSGTMLIPPETLLALGGGYLEMPSAAGTPYQHTSILASKAYLALQRPVVLAYVRALSEAIAAMKQDEAGSIAVLAQYLKLDVEKDRAALKVTFQQLIVDTFQAEPWPSTEGMAFLIAQMPIAPGAKTVTTNDVIDTSLLDDLVKDGFLKPRSK